jgi:hypothetical protein
MIDVLLVEYKGGMDDGDDDDCLSKYVLLQQ